MSLFCSHAEDLGVSMLNLESTCCPPLLCGASHLAAAEKRRTGLGGIRRVVNCPQTTLCDVNGVDVMSLMRLAREVAGG